MSAAAVIVSGLVLALTVAFFVAVLIRLPALNPPRQELPPCREVRVPLRAFVSGNPVIEEWKDIRTNERVFRFRWDEPAAASGLVGKERKR